MGIIGVPRTSKELTGVTVSVSIPPATQKGDTVQFNASQFKTNPDATVEDLARKIPGITIENGQVKAGGENVQKVTIDGRELFGDDATAALRNLPAEIVDKIQVFDRLSDQAGRTVSLVVPFFPQRNIADAEVGGQVDDARLGVH